MLTLMDITQLPFNRLIGLERSDREGFLFRLPAGERYENHLGTVHGGALMALAEASSGEALLEAIGHLGNAIVPVVRRFDAKFRRPALGAISARGAIPVADRDNLLADLSARGRASIRIAVEVLDEAGQPCLSASVEWFITFHSSGRPD